MLKQLILLGIRAYQVALSPLFPARCRFYPTCSHYAKEAVETHGVRRGALLALRRLLKCHPFHEGGVDLVPPHSPVEQKDGP
jgi:putative membrane protein insertion efficiency factor